MHHADPATAPVASYPEVIVGFNVFDASLKTVDRSPSGIIVYAANGEIAAAKTDHPTLVSSHGDKNRLIFWQQPIKY